MGVWKNMKTLSVGSLKNLSNSAEGVASPQKEALPTSEGQTNSSEPVTISVPRTKAVQGERSADPLSAAEALASSIREMKEAASVHSGIDASRVFDLLNED